MDESELTSHRELSIPSVLFTRFGGAASGHCLRAGGRKQQHIAHKQNQGKQTLSFSNSLPLSLSLRASTDRKCSSAHSFRAIYVGWCFSGRNTRSDRDGDRHGDKTETADPIRCACLAGFGAFCKD